MKWQGHLISGVAAGALLAPAVPVPGLPDTTALVALGAAVGGVFALFPDLDHRRSKLTYALGPITWVISRLLIGLAIAVYSVSRGRRDPPDCDGHRELTHTPVFQALLSACLAHGLDPLVLPGWGAFIGLVTFAGQLAHTLGDACTIQGVPLLWPVSVRGRRWARLGIPRPLRFETGGPVGEPLATGLLSLTALYLGVATLGGFHPLT